MPFSKGAGSKAIYYLKANYDMFPFLIKNGNGNSLFPLNMFDWNLDSVYKTHLIFNFLKFSGGTTVASFSTIGGPRWIYSPMIS